MTDKELEEIGDKIVRCFKNYLRSRNTCRYLRIRLNL